MKTALDHVVALFHEGQPLFDHYAGEETTRDIAGLLQAKQASSTPTVMVFGLYNAGKSTLLNALMGEERAAMSDSPETSVVTAYRWNGLTLLDTPGIDAPRDHEQTSRQQLERSDVVLFVMSTDGVFDEQDMYQEILAIHATGRRIMVIVNNKNGYQQSDRDYRIIYDKIMSNLQNLGPANVIQQIPVRLVNARAALKGKLNGKTALMAASGIGELEREIERFINQTQADDIARPLRQQVIKLVELSLARLESRAAGSDMRLIGEIQAAVQGERARVDQTVMAAVHRALYGFRSAFRAAVDTQDKAAMQDALNQVIETATLTLEREIMTAGASLSRFGASLASRQSLQVSSTGFGAGIESTGEDPEAGNDRTRLADITPMISSLTTRLSTEAVEAATKKAVLESLKYIKDVVPSLMKGIGKVGMERIAGKVGAVLGKATPLLGPAIDAVLSIRNYYQACRDEARHEQMLQQRAQAIADCVEQTASHLEAELLDACRSVITLVFQPVEEKLHASFSTLSIEEQAYIEDRHVLGLLGLRLQGEDVCKPSTDITA